jgi:hypothetical protein
LNAGFLRARSAPTLPPWNCGLLRTLTAGKKRLVSGAAKTVGGSCSFTVCPVRSRPSQPLVAARLLPDASYGMRALRRSSMAVRGWCAPPAESSAFATQLLWAAELAGALTRLRALPLRCQLAGSRCCTWPGSRPRRRVLWHLQRQGTIPGPWANSSAARSRQACRWARWRAPRRRACCLRRLVDMTPACSRTSRPPSPQSERIKNDFFVGVASRKLVSQPAPSMPTLMRPEAPSRLKSGQWM